MPLDRLLLIVGICGFVKWGIGGGLLALAQILGSIPRLTLDSVGVHQLICV